MAPFARITAIIGARIAIGASQGAAARARPGGADVRHGADVAIAARHGVGDKLTTLENVTAICGAEVAIVAGRCGAG